MSHDYDPNWDYPVCELSDYVGLGTLSESEAAQIESEVERIRRELAPAMGFPGVEVFFVEACGLGLAEKSPDAARRNDAVETSDDGSVVAVYCNGTSSRPVIGIDVTLTKEICADEGADFMTQIRVSLAHELGHAYQEALGFDHENEHGFDEDDAEEFARNWADWGEISLWLLNPEIGRPGTQDRGVAAVSPSGPEHPEQPDRPELPEWLAKVLASHPSVNGVHPNWPAVLAGAPAIAAYVAQHASDHVDHELVEEHFRDSQALLIKVPARKITIDPARADGNARSRKKERKYTALPAKTMPPILVDENGAVQDGHHRLRSALKRKDPYIWCYVAIDDRIDLKAILAMKAMRAIKAVKNSSEPVKKPRQNLIKP